MGDLAHITKMGFPDADDCCWVREDFRDAHFMQRYARAKKTALKLAMSGRLDALPIRRKHIGFGHYERKLNFHAAIYADRQPQNIPGIKIVYGFMCFKTYIHEYGVHGWTWRSLELMTNGDSTFVKVWDLYKGWIWAEMERRLLKDTNRAGFILDPENVLDVMAWQEACKNRAKLLRARFEDEIQEAQERWMESNIKGTRLNFDGHIRLRFRRQIHAGAFSSVKREIANAKRYKYSSKNMGTSQAHSRQQLRALGIVA